MAQQKSYDAIIIGGGHNGLTCACYLAGAGLKVRVIERRAIVGGAAVTEEFVPGFRNSTAAYRAGLLHPKVIADLRLAERGVRIIERPLANFLPLPAERCLRIGSSLPAMQTEVARFSLRDAERLPAYFQMLGRAVDFLRELALETPPNAGGGLLDRIRMARAGHRLRRLDLRARRDLLDLFTRSAGEVLDSWFETAALKAAFGFDSVAGNFATPYAAGSAYLLLHHAIGEVNGKRGAWGHVVGGMGAVTQAMAEEALDRGVEISTECEVAKVCIDQRGVRGVQLADGKLVDARCVVANVNPRLLYLRMLDGAVLDPDFIQRMHAYRCGSATFRMNVALAELPDFSCFPGKVAREHHQSGIIIGPSLAYFEQAYFDARSFGCSRAPVIEMVIPSTVDETLAPHGRHVASLFCQHFNPELPEGLKWDEIKEAAADMVIDTVARHAPNFKAAVLGRSVLSPPDLEREFGLVGGDIFHGALTLPQLWNARPVLGHGNYRGPLAGLYMCGAGTHPGGGVTGIPGHNAAREVLRDLRRGRMRRRSGARA